MSGRSQSLFAVYSTLHLPSLSVSSYISLVKRYSLGEELLLLLSLIRHPSIIQLGRAIIDEVSTQPRGVKPFRFHVPIEEEEEAKNSIIITGSKQTRTIPPLHGNQLCRLVRIRRRDSSHPWRDIVALFEKETDCHSRRYCLHKVFASSGVSLADAEAKSLDYRRVLNRLNSQNHQRIEHDLDTLCFKYGLIDTLLAFDKEFNRMTMHCAAQTAAEKTVVVEVFVAALHALIQRLYLTTEQKRKVFTSFFIASKQSPVSLMMKELTRSSFTTYQMLSFISQFEPTIEISYPSTGKRRHENDACLDSNKSINDGDDKDDDNVNVHRWRGKLIRVSDDSQRLYFKSLQQQTPCEDENDRIFFSSAVVAVEDIQTITYKL